MKGKTWRRTLALTITCTVMAGWMAPRILAGSHVKPRQTPESDMTAFSISPQPPKGAILLYTGQADQLNTLWYQRNTKNPAKWAVDSNGIATPDGNDITTKQEFGDCYVHVEFKEPGDADGKPLNSGNSGVGLQGRYEIQILDSYGKALEKHGCGSLYGQKAARVNASKKPGEWQTYEIIFRAPRFDTNGQITEKPRATVFQNGILIQDNEEFTGMTGIQYDEYKEMTQTGPLVLQGDHDPVQFRNVWIVPL